MKESTFKKIARVIDAADCLNDSFENFIPLDDAEYYDNADALLEVLEQENAFNIEIIYYSNAIKYLSEHDPSLTEALGIAEEYGYSVSSLNSEILASLLASQKAREDFEDLMGEIDDIIDENE